MKVEYKVTCWHRFDIDDKHKDELLEFLKQNPSASGDDIYEWHYKKTGFDSMIYPVEETETEMSLKDNDGYSTIEITDVDHSDELIYQNGV